MLVYWFEFFLFVVGVVVYCVCCGDVVVFGDLVV